MADITFDQLKGSLNAEQQTFLDNHLKSVSEGAVTTFKTELEDARKKAIPDKYEFKVAKDSPLDPTGHVAKIADFAKSHGLTSEQAQKLYDEVHGVASDVVSRQQQAMTDRATKWEEDTWADKELGGDNRPKTELHIKRALDKFAPESSEAGKAFRAMVNESGYGNHPAFVRLFNAIGKAMAEDKTLSILGGGGPSGDKKKPIADRMYPNQQSS